MSRSVKRGRNAMSFRFEPHLWLSFPRPSAYGPRWLESLWRKSAMITECNLNVRPWYHKAIIAIYLFLPIIIIILLEHSVVTDESYYVKVEGYDTNRNLVQPLYKSTQIPESAQVPESGKEIWKSEILFEI